MPTQQRSGPSTDTSLLVAGGKPVMLATLDVPFAEQAAAFAVDTAVETGQPLIVVNGCGLTAPPPAPR